MISTETYEKFLNIVSKLSVKPIIAVTGGEPFLHEKFLEIITLTIQKGFSFSITTNGTIINSSVIDICKDNAQFRNFIVSLDSSDENIHNKIRGSKNAFKSTVDFIEVLQKNEIPFCINMTVNENNYLDVEKTIKFAQKLNAKDISIATVKPEGRGTATLKFHQLKSIADQIIDNLYLFCDDFKIYATEITFFLYALESYKDAISSGEKWSCAFGDRSLHVKLNGDILGCATCNLTTGNIFADEKFDLEYFWKENKILNKVRNKDNLNGICGTCEYKNFCGGCRCRAYALTNDICGDDLYCPIINKNHI